MKRTSRTPLAFAAVAAAVCLLDARVLAETITEADLKARAVTYIASAPVRAPGTADRIESLFRQTYVYTTYLKDDAVIVEARDGVVTLAGTVAEEAHKGLAQETAANLPGVIRVDNRLESQAEAAAENADTWIRRKVEFALLVHRNVSARNTTVEVKDGIVTLRGEAANAAQKVRADEYARDIDGVKAVRNEMTLSAMPLAAERNAGERMDDASVTAQVKTALWTHRSTSSMKPRVETRDGEVVLTGMVRTAAEKSLVSQLISDIRGVIRVNNQMMIANAKTE